MADDIMLKVNGEAYTGWKSVSIKRTLANLSASFNLTVTDIRNGQALRPGIQKGMACEVWIGSNLVITGWVDSRDRKLTAKDHSISIGGRSRTSDLVDCSAVSKPGSWKNQKLDHIAASLIAPFGLKLKVLTDVGAPFAHFAIEAGEDVFSAIHRACRQRGVLLGSDALSNVTIFKPSWRLLKGSLELGRNIKEIGVDDDATELFGLYYLKGQSQGGDWTTPQDAAGPMGTAKDAGVTRYRPLLIISDEQATKKGLENRAHWEATTRSAKAQKVTTTVRGWRDEDGVLWEPGTLIPVHAVEAEVDMTLMISDVTHGVDAEGKMTTLSLVRPEAYTVETLPEAGANKKKKKDGGFSKLDGAITFTPDQIIGSIDKLTSGAKKRAEEVKTFSVGDILGGKK